MKRTARRTRRVPPASTELGFGAAWGDFADNSEGRASERLVDYEDEREAVEFVVQRMIRSES